MDTTNSERPTNVEISIDNLNNLNNVNCEGFALLSEIKKKEPEGSFFLYS